MLLRHRDLTVTVTVTRPDAFEDRLQNGHTVHQGNTLACNKTVHEA